MSKWIVVLGLVGGCWRGDTTESTTPASPEVETAAPRERGAPCDEVADHVRDVMAASNEGPVARRAGQYRELIGRRCTSDGWSMELKRCLIASPSLDDTNGCEKLATPEQQQALEQDIELMLNAN